jgi:hypothetical protein
MREREKCLVRLFLFVIRLEPGKLEAFSSHLPEAPIVPVSDWEQWATLPTVANK